MALCLQRSFVSIRRPSTCFTSSSNLRRTGTGSRVSVRRLDSAQLKPYTWRRELQADRRGLSRLVSLAASNEDLKPDTKSEKKDESEVKIENPQETWKESLDYFKSEALKLKSTSEEAYQVYSKKAAAALLDLSKTLKIQADKAQKDLSRITKEIGEEGQEYFSKVSENLSENSPEETKEVVSVLRESYEVKNLEDVRDYHIGVVYGSFLSICGFLSFMVTGSTAAIRFGVILGFVLVLLGIWSRRTFKAGGPSPLSFKAQTAIAAWIFLREVVLFSQRGSFMTFVRILISGAVTAFYVYIMLTSGSQNKGQSTQTQQSSDV